MGPKRHRATVTLVRPAGENLICRAVPVKIKNKKVAGGRFDKKLLSWIISGSTLCGFSEVR
jgi:hypothetical protein